MIYYNLWNQDCPTVPSTPVSKQHVFFSLLLLCHIQMSIPIIRMSPYTLKFVVVKD